MPRSMTSWRMRPLRAAGSAAIRGTHRDSLPAGAAGDADNDAVPDFCAARADGAQ